MTTSTALTRYEQTTSLELAPEAWKLASRVANTEFVPKQLRNKPEAVLACILAGHEAGVSPMQALSKIHVVDGRPAMSSELMRALVLKAGHEIWVEEASSERVIMSGVRKGSERPSRVTWTMDDARRARLVGKDNWKSYPRAMLLARATTELCRMLFPDVLAGISHSIEELSDGDVDESLLDLGPVEVVHGDSSQDAISATASPTPRKAAAAATAATGAPDPGEIPAHPPAAGEVPDLPGEDEPEIVDADVIEDAEVVDESPAPPPPEPEPDEPLEEWEGNPDPPPETDGGKTYTGPQLIAMKLNAHGVRDRPSKLRAVEQILDERAGQQRAPGWLQSTNDLTADDIAHVLEHLEGLDEGVTLIVDVPPPPADPPPERTTAVTPPDEWDEDRWRNFLKHRNVKVAPAMKEAQRLAHEAGLDTIATLGDLVGSPISGDLVGWIEEQ